ncbi:MAG TPA: hypothetical protein VFY98_13165 [Intrasporangium sp.]|nr:hypothetical protein [Intrasporangium sp.]
MSVLSNPRRSSRLAAGVGLIGFSALLPIEDRVDPGGDSFYDAAVAHPGQLTASSLILLASAILTVPAITGLIHQAHGRGAVLARIGGFFALLGAFGHAGLAVVYLAMRSLAGGDPVEMAGFEERLNADIATGIVVIVLLLSFGVGLTLLAWAAMRAGLIGWWAPTVITAVVLAHAVLPEDLPPVIPFTALIAIAVVFGLLGLRALAMTDAEWSPSPSVESAMRVGVAHAGSAAATQ